MNAAASPTAKPSRKEPAKILLNIKSMTPQSPLLKPIWKTLLAVREFTGELDVFTHQEVAPPPEEAERLRILVDKVHAEIYRLLGFGPPLPDEPERRQQTRPAKATPVAEAAAVEAPAEAAPVAEAAAVKPPAEATPDRDDSETEQEVDAADAADELPINEAQREDDTAGEIEERVPPPPRPRPGKKAKPREEDNLDRAIKVLQQQQIDLDSTRPPKEQIEAEYAIINEAVRRAQLAHWQQQEAGGSAPAQEHSATWDPQGEAPVYNTISEWPGAKAAYAELLERLEKEERGEVSD